MIKIVVPLTPPTVNHYMKQRVANINGRSMVMYYPSKEAKAWWNAVAASTCGQSLDAKEYEVAYVVYQGTGERGDVDNYSKCILDAIVKAGVIATDHRITALHQYKRRDRDRPRTEIFVRQVGQLDLLDIPPLPSIDGW